METFVKDGIVEAAKEYKKQQTLSDANLAKFTNINPAYISQMMARKYAHEETEIADKYFLILADFIGHELKETHWKIVPTPTFKKMMEQLVEAKDLSATKMLIAPTGEGKTFAVERFTLKHPLHTFKITVNDIFNLNDTLKELGRLLDIEYRGGMAWRLRLICAKLRALKQGGCKPIIIFDEMENANIKLIRAIKSLYDAVKDYAGIVLIGTHHLTLKLNILLNKDEVGAPQFMRRFKAGTVNLTSYDRTAGFNLFYEAMDIRDRGLQKMLNSLCNNYGELHDYLQPAIAEATAKGVSVTEDFFRLKYNMPK